MSTQIIIPRTSFSTITDVSLQQRYKKKINIPSSLQEYNLTQSFK